MPALVPGGTGTNIGTMEPFDPTSQRRTERQWMAALRTHAAPDQVRGVVRDSWERCLNARLQPHMACAPITLDETALALSRENADWMPMADQVVRRREGEFGGPGHILTLFDSRGRMLSSQGDPRALEGLAEINFRPGGLWAEGAVGTNGPGTALATGAPVHIVGAEHFCQTWHRWHCAAVPIRDPATGELLGVLDISGFREYAHPHSLDLAKALAVAIQQMLVAREAERRVMAMGKLTELATRYPGEAALAVDRGGRVLCASPSVPAGLRGASRSPWIELVRRTTGPEPRPVDLTMEEWKGSQAIWHPVLDGRTPVGGCLVLQRASSRRSVAALPMPSVGYTFADVVGHSAAIEEARRLARAAATNALPVLLLGESGTGKEVFAQAIHAAGHRAHRPFVAVNCAALPRELIESELFGYAAGAYTGAQRAGAIGKFEAADGGTIFLDEIGELSPQAQAALLRVLQEGEVTRVGGTKPRKVDVRVLAATNREITESLAQGRIRSDVFHRLDVLRIQLPALRRRRADIRELTLRFVADAALELGRAGASVSEDLLVAFEGAAWPGNVRELKNAVRRLVAMAESFPVTAAQASRLVAQPPGGASDERPEADEDDGMDHVLAVIAEARTMDEAARRLGVTRSTLYRRLQRHGFRPRRVFRPM